MKLSFVHVNTNNLYFKNGNQIHQGKNSKPEDYDIVVKDKNKTYLRYRHDIGVYNDYTLEEVDEDFVFKLITSKFPVVVFNENYDARLIMSRRELLSVVVDYLKKLFEN